MLQVYIFQLSEGVIVHNEPGTWARSVKQMKYVSLEVQ